MSKVSNYELIDGLVEKYAVNILERRIYEFWEHCKKIAKNDKDMQVLFKDKVLFTVYYCKEVWDIGPYMDILAGLLAKDRYLALSEKFDEDQSFELKVEYAKNIIYYLSEGAYEDWVVVDTITELRRRAFIEGLSDDNRSKRQKAKKKLTPACQLLLQSLWYKFNYFKKRNGLKPDGSFWYDDKRLAEERGIDKKTISRAKRILIEEGYIRVNNGKAKGIATFYWVLRKEDKMSPYKPLDKIDKMSIKPPKLSSKGTQNVTLNNINNKEINNSIKSDSDLKEMHLITEQFFKDIASKKSVV